MQCAQCVHPALTKLLRASRFAQAWRARLDTLVPLDLPANPTQRVQHVPVARTKLLRACQRVLVRHVRKANMVLSVQHLNPPQCAQIVFRARLHRPRVNQLARARRVQLASLVPRVKSVKPLPVVTIAAMDFSVRLPVPVLGRRAQSVIIAPFLACRRPHSVPP